MKIFRFFGKMIGAVLVLVFIFSMFLSIFLLAFTTQLFNPDFYMEVFEEQEFFDQLPGIAATQIRYSMTYNPCLEDPDMCENDGPPEEGGEGGPPSYFQALSEDDWETLLMELLPEDWLENQVDDLIHNLIESIRTGSEDIPVGISLLELKEHLTGESGVEAITGVMKAQPECTQDDLLEITRILEGSEESGTDFLSCSPGDEFLDNYAPQIEVMLKRSLEDIPEEIDLAKGLQGKEISIDALDIELPLTVIINYVRWMILVSPLLNLLLLLVIAFLAVHSFKGLAGWWGYPTAIAGLLATGLASLVGPAANFLIDKFGFDSPMPGLHEDLIDAASGLALEIIHVIFTQARNYALIVTGVGLTIIIVASVLKGRAPKPDQDQDTEPETGDEEPIPDDDLGEAAPQDQEQPSPPEEEDSEAEEEDSKKDDASEKDDAQDQDQEEPSPPEEEDSEVEVKDPNKDDDSEKDAPQDQVQEGD